MELTMNMLVGIAAAYVAIGISLFIAAGFLPEWWRTLCRASVLALFLPIALIGGHGILIMPALLVLIAVALGSGDSSGVLFFAPAYVFQGVAIFGIYVFVRYAARRSQARTPITFPPRPTQARVPVTSEPDESGLWSIGDTVLLIFTLLVTLYVIAISSTLFLYMWNDAVGTSHRRMPIVLELTPAFLASLAAGTFLMSALESREKFRILTIGPLFFSALTVMVCAMGIRDAFTARLDFLLYSLQLPVTLAAGIVCGAFLRKKLHRCSASEYE